MIAGGSFFFGEDADLFLFVFILLLVLLHLMHHGVRNHLFSVWRHIFAAISFRNFATWPSAYRLCASNDCASRG